MAHEYMVSLVISGPGLDLDAVTEDLGREPFRTTSENRRQLGSAPPQRGVAWIYDGDARIRGKSWNDLETGICALLDDIEPLSVKVRAYGSTHQVTIRCGHFQSSFDGGPRLSPALMGRIATLGAFLEFDNYFHGESEEPG